MKLTEIVGKREILRIVVSNEVTSFNFTSHFIYIVNTDPNPIYLAGTSIKSVFLVIV